jgi:hypothetical protein
LNAKRTIFHQNGGSEAQNADWQKEEIQKNLYLIEIGKGRVQMT